MEASKKAAWQRLNSLVRPDKVGDHHLFLKGIAMKLFYFYCLAAALLAACSDKNPASSTSSSDEESAQQYGTGQTYDHTRAGARLILSYDAATNAFTGTVENTTSATLPQVRVEVHLSNGTELGPTPPVDLAPGQTIAITLEATSEPFATWSAHPEVGGDGSGGEGGESGGEHSGEGEGGESGGEDSG